MKLIDIAGQSFGRLLVLEKMPPRKGGGSDWRCRCDCGGEIVAIGSNIRKGDTRSCGCLAMEHASDMGSRSEYVAKRAAAVTVHGHKRRHGLASSTYLCWLGMKRRCYDTNHKDYPTWGGRGIVVCARWNESFVSFLEDMGEKPAGNYSIDRLDSNGHYEPGNCRWATMQQQGGENRRGFRPVTAAGISFPTMTAACAHFGVALTLACERIRAGIPEDVAVSTVGRLKPRRGKHSYAIGRTRSTKGQFE